MVGGIVEADTATDCLAATTVQLEQPCQGLRRSESHEANRVGGIVEGTLLLTAWQRLRPKLSSLVKVCDAVKATRRTGLVNSSGGYSTVLLLTAWQRTRRMNERNWCASVANGLNAPQCSYASILSSDTEPGLTLTRALCWELELPNPNWPTVLCTWRAATSCAC